MSPAVVTGVLRSDIRIRRIALYYLPVKARMPLAFGSVRVSGVTCLRVALDVENRRGTVSRGWGEVPLNVQWMWPDAPVSYQQCLQSARFLAEEIARRLPETLRPAHPIEISSAFIAGELPEIAADTARRTGLDDMPAALRLGVFSAFDVALHDAFGTSNGIPAFSAYTAEYLRRDLRFYLDGDPSFAGMYPGGFLRTRPKRTLDAWHLVGAEDPLEEEELTGSEPRDGFPVLLRDWIRTDGLHYLKIKLRGADIDRDVKRYQRIAGIARQEGVRALSVDFNGRVREQAYLMEFLSRVKEEPGCLPALMFVEQPFSADSAERGVSVREIARQVPLIMDEAALDWQAVRQGASLGWCGAALKSCKTHTGMLLAYCWLRSRGLKVMVHDLTNPMLAHLSHLQMAANLHTAAGVETNSMQFYPQASDQEARIHRGAYRRRNGQVNLSTLRGAGFGYRLEEIKRMLPEPETVVESAGAGG